MSFLFIHKTIYLKSFVNIRFCRNIGSPQTWLAFLFVLFCLFAPMNDAISYYLPFAIIKSFINENLNQNIFRLLFCHIRSEFCVAYTIIVASVIIMVLWLMFWRCFVCCFYYLLLYAVYCKYAYCVSYRIVSYRWQFKYFFFSSSTFYIVQALHGFYVENMENPFMIQYIPPDNRHKLHNTNMNVHSIMFDKEKS